MPTPISLNLSQPSPTPIGTAAAAELDRLMDASADGAGGTFGIEANRDGVSAELAGDVVNTPKFHVRAVAFAQRAWTGAWNAGGRLVGSWGGK